MKIYRCLLANSAEPAFVTDFTAAGQSAALLQGSLQEGFTPTGEMVVVRELLAPLEPSCVLAIGLNYRMHAAELKLAEPAFPVVFNKWLGSVHPAEQPIRFPDGSIQVEQLDYEAELAIILAHPLRNADPATASAAIFGYSIANDVSARDWQIPGERSGGQWSRAKSFDTFLPLGPCIVTADEMPPNRVGDLRISCRVNGETLQDSRTSDTIFSMAEIVSFLSQGTTLPASTVIITGTPAGVGIGRTPQRFLVPGDVVEIEIEGIGVLRNSVVE